MVKYHDVPFIFLTSNSDTRTVERAKECQPSAYLTKPFKKEDLHIAIEIAMHNYTKLHSDRQNIQFVFVKQSNLFQKVNITDVSYLKSEGNYVEIHLNSGKKYLERGSMSEILLKFPEDFLFQVHRSFLVNLEHLSAVNSSFILINNEKISIGRKYYPNLLKKLNIS